MNDMSIAYIAELIALLISRRTYQKYGLHKLYVTA